MRRRSAQAHEFGGDRVERLHPRDGPHVLEERRPQLEIGRCRDLAYIGELTPETGEDLATPDTEVDDIHGLREPHRLRAELLEEWTAERVIHTRDVDHEL